MSEERKKVLQRFHERLAHLESGVLSGPAHWHIFHLHNALNALPDDHAAADLHLDEFDRADLAKEYPRWTPTRRRPCRRSARAST